MKRLKKLWRWDDNYEPGELAEKTMREILPFVDVVIGNEEDASDVLGIKAGLMLILLHAHSPRK